MFSDPVLIIGGGLIGLSIGWQLQRNNINTIILEKGAIGRQASWMAAGMLAPFSEAGFKDQEKLALGELSLSLYPRFLEELKEDSGVNLALEGKGTLFVAINSSDREWLEWIYAFKKREGLPLEWLSEEEVRAKEPLLSPRITGGVFLPTEKQIHHRALIHALQSAFVSQGGILKEGAEVSEILQKNNHFTGVMLSTGEEFRSERGVLAAGAWSSLFSFPECKEIRPVKGQIISARTPARLRLSHMVRTPRVYLAQKSDGTLRIGASSEEKGFDQTASCGAVLQLLESTFEIFPAIEEVVFEGAEVAFRPVSKTDLPIVQSSSLSGFHFAIGHGRGGILLTPYTAYQMAAIIGESFYGNQIERPTFDSFRATNSG
jgi:glycine oxidase